MSADHHVLPRLGWKYVEAREESQKYKVGKFILETKRIRMGVNWENDDDLDDLTPIYEQNDDDGGDEEVEFDSQDEDECEDLFGGVWNPQLAKKRRDRKLRFENRGMASVYARAAGAEGNGSGRTRSEDTFS
jgi:hypothetical protein